MLGKRLGKQMGAVAGAVRMLSTEQLLAYEAGGSLEVAGVTLGPGDVKIFRDFKPPAGVTPGEQSAGGWGAAGLGVAGGGISVGGWGARGRAGFVGGCGWDWGMAA